MKIRIDQNTAHWFRVTYSGGPVVRGEREFRRRALELLHQDSEGHYLDLTHMNRDAALELAINLIERSMGKSFDESFKQLALLAAEYAGMDAIRRLAEIAEPTTAKVTHTRKTARQIAMEKLKEREKEREAVDTPPS